MVFHTAPIGRHLAELVIVLILAINQSSTTTTLTEATFIAPKQVFWVGRDMTPTWHHKIILDITRGGGNATNSVSTDEGRGNISGRTNQQHDSQEIVRNVIGAAYQRLEELEQKMQELVLDQSSKNMPLLEFGTLVQDILHTVDMKLKEQSGMNDAFRRGLMKGIIVEVQRLYGDQLQALRNYYGQRYESILDEEVEEDADNDEVIERRWAAGAEHMTQAFVAAARNAVPAMFRTDHEDAKAGTKIKNQVSFDHVEALQGLIKDMIESTERRKDDRDVTAIAKATEEEDDDADDSSTSARIFRLPKLPKWLERLAARAFVFGVNYVQGWLAWQGIKRAAIERDRNQPKFPLF